jgi:hypothetical protein
MRREPLLLGMALSVVEPVENVSHELLRGEPGARWQWSPESPVNGPHARVRR